MLEILETLENLPRSNRRITVEQVLLGGENDRPQDARELLRQPGRLAASGIRPHVNLIAFNPWSDPSPGPPHRPGTEEDAERFLQAVSTAGYVATLRRSRGGDVRAACGQLTAPSHTGTKPLALRPLAERLPVYRLRPGPSGPSRL